MSVSGYFNAFGGSDTRLMRQECSSTIFEIGDGFEAERQFKALRRARFSDDEARELIGGQP
jgi:hypothetical protein